MVFIDNILIYSKMLEEHKEHLQKALERLRCEQLYAKLKKCEFCLDSMSFLGEWTRPISVFEIQSFLGLTSYYRRFIEGFSKLSGPLTGLIKKNAHYIWTDECEKSFQKLKKCLITA
jgi:hypothetical protein